MATVQSWFDEIGGILKGFVELLFGLAIVIIVVNVIFGTGLDIIGNVSDFVGNFTGEGVTGLIVFLIILAIYKR